MDTDVEISILLCNDAFIRGLNREHRGQDTPTDVLSFGQQGSDDFPIPPEIDRCAVLGDVVISLETAARQALTAGWPLESEAVLLAVHGVLHLLGYDDATADGAALMRDKAGHALHDCEIELPARLSHPYFIEYN